MAGPELQGNLNSDFAAFAGTPKPKYLHSRRDCKPNSIISLKAFILALPLLPLDQTQLLGPTTAHAENHARTSNIREYHRAGHFELKASELKVDIIVIKHLLVQVKALAGALLLLEFQSTFRVSLNSPCIGPKLHRIREGKSKRSTAA